MAGYNLIDEQWIPVMTGTGHARLGLRDVFREAGRIRLSTDTFERFVLTRFMSAILLRAVTRANPADPKSVWAGMWESGRLDVDAIDAYLTEWHDRFDLFAPATPFMQDPTLDTRRGPRPISGIFTQEQTGLFTMDRRAEIPYDDAALALLMHQAYDSSGIKPMSKHDSRGSVGKLMPPTGLMACGNLGRQIGVWVESDSLARTLLANCPPYDPVTGRVTLDPADTAAWERPCQTVEELGRGVAGTADQLTIQSRRVLLHRNDNGMVDGYQSTYGRVTDRRDLEGVEPNCAWTRGSLPMPVGQHWSDPPAWVNLPGLDGNMVLEWLADTDLCDMVDLHLTGFEYKNTKPAEQLERDVRLDPHILKDEQRMMRLGRILGQISVTITFLIDLKHIRVGDAIQVEPVERERMRAESAREIDDLMTASLASGNPLDETLPDRTYHRLHEFAERKALASRNVMRAAEALIKLEHAMGAVRNALSEPQTVEPGPNETQSDIPKRGRRGTPIIRINPDDTRVTHETMRAAVEWLHDNGYPGAQPPNVYSAINRGGTAYGYRWERQKKT